MIRYLKSVWQDYYNSAFRKRFLVFLFVSGWAALDGLVLPASAWYAHMHYDMSKAVLDGLPSDVRSRINPEAFLFGANEPDRTMFDPMKAQNDRGYKGFEDIDWVTVSRRTGISSASLQNLISPSCYHGSQDCVTQKRNQLKDAIKESPQDWNKISVRMGQLSHDLEDLHQPYHAAESLKLSGIQPGAHENFEKKASEIYKTSGIRLVPPTGGQPTRDWNAMAGESAGMINQESRILNKDQLECLLNNAVADTAAYINAALVEAQKKQVVGPAKQEAENIRNQIRNLRDQSTDKIRDLGEQLKDRLQDAIQDHKQAHPDLWKPPAPTAGASHGQQESGPCNFKWTHPRCNRTYCCPYNNGFDKECLNAGTCDPGVEGCMKSFGCRRVE